MTPGLYLAPRVAIGIPFYNDERYLASTVGSVQSQEDTDWRLILVDDGSTDGSPAIAHDLASADERITVVTRANGGVAAARNTVLSAVPNGTSYVMFLDHDDRLRPDALRVLRSTLDRQPTAIAAHGIACNIDADGEPYRPGECEAWSRLREKEAHGRVVASRPEEPTTFRNFAFGQCVATTGACLFRLDALTAVGPWDVDIKGADDYDMYLRLTNRGQFAFVDQVVIDYRWHGENTSGDFGLMHHGYMASKRKAWRSATTTAENRSILGAAYRLAARRWMTLDVDHVRSSVRDREFRAAIHGCARLGRDTGRWARGLH